MLFRLCAEPVQLHIQEISQQALQQRVLVFVPCSSDSNWLCRTGCRHCLPTFLSWVNVGELRQHIQKLCISCEEIISEATQTQLSMPALQRVLVPSVLSFFCGAAETNWASEFTSLGALLAQRVKSVRDAHSYPRPSSSLDINSFFWVKGCLSVLYM